MLSSVLLAGCGKQSFQLAQGWTPPVVVTSAQNADAGGGDLYKWHDTLILMNDHQDWLPHSSICSSSTSSVMIRNNDLSNSWTQLTPIQVPGHYAFYCPAFDQANDRIMFGGGYIESNELHMSAIFFRMAANGKILIEAERTWTRDQQSFFGKTDSSVTLNEPAIRARQPNRDYPRLGKGILDGLEVYVPYLLKANTFIPPNTSSHGPYSSGVFYSADSGETWQLEKISELSSGESEMCKTKDYNYYFGIGGKIWSSRKAVDGGSWSPPQILTQTFSGRRGGGAVAEGDTVHFCWLDRRHEKWRFSIDDTYVGNYEVFYRQRKDADSTWQKDIIISKGLLFSYWPSMSVEGDRIVVAWQSEESNQPGHSSDIYYATSKDGGKKWTRPLKVTDRAKDGFTSERPQVAVQNGVIHLFYAQGKWDSHVQVSQQGGWPIYYQQRPFPN